MANLQTLNAKVSNRNFGTVKNFEEGVFQISANETHDTKVFDFGKGRWHTRAATSEGSPFLYAFTDVKVTVILRKAMDGFYTESLSASWSYLLKTYHWHEVGAILQPACYEIIFRNSAGGALYTWIATMGAIDCDVLDQPVTSYGTLDGPTNLYKSIAECTVSRLSYNCTIKQCHRP